MLAAVLASLAPLAGGVQRLDVGPGGGTLADLLDALAVEHPLLFRWIRGQSGGVRRFVHVDVDVDGAGIHALPSVAGG